VLLQELPATPCAEFSCIECSFAFPKPCPLFCPHYTQVHHPGQIHHHWILHNGALLRCFILCRVVPFPVVLFCVVSCCFV
jgi:hypothetical protein